MQNAMRDIAHGGCATRPTPPSNEPRKLCSAKTDMLRWRWQGEELLVQQGEAKMLKKLGVKNFRSIESCDVEFAPITIFFGPTSAGKSTLFYALLVLRNFILNPNQALDGLFNFVDDQQIDGTFLSF